MRKSKFLTFFFSILPGLGHYYLGQIIRGFQMMAIFFGTVFVFSFSGISGYPFLLPVIWFFVAFDALEQHRIIHEKNEVIDTPLIPLEKIKFKKQWIGWGLIILGAYALIDKILYRFFRYQYTDIFRTMIISFVFIGIGWYLIAGNRINNNHSEERGSVE